jgi:hypothetical protein
MKDFVAFLIIVAFVAILGSFFWMVYQANEIHIDNLRNAKRVVIIDSGNSFVIGPTGKAIPVSLREAVEIQHRIENQGN